MALYDIRWNILSSEVRKSLAYSMQRTQNGAIFSVGPYYKLNMEAAAMVRILRVGIVENEKQIVLKVK